MKGPARRAVEEHGIRPGDAARRFPGFDVLSQVHVWDTVTAGVVLARLGPLPPLRFFTTAEEAIGTRLFDLLLDQDAEPRVPVLRMVDARLAEAETDGWRYHDMPEDGEAFRRTFAALDSEALRAYATPFVELDWHDGADLVQYVQDLNGKDWHGMPAGHVWSLWTRYACTAFYAHPWAWNEIGFPGPAYPRGYANLTNGDAEPWEANDVGGRRPVAWGAGVERARRRHAAAITRLRRAADPHGSAHGVGAELARDEPTAPVADRELAEGGGEH
jgi:hypothetical protein